tara:strand:- start:23448 stop:24227 length:780 start_codon:yes stop_codon:yes gene_type:complete
VDRDFSRQNFLGDDSQEVFESTHVSVVGCGGGGSQIGTALSHIGFLNYTLVDPDTVDNSNLVRMLGATKQDVEEETPKIKIVERVIKGINPNANVELVDKRWQDAIGTSKLSKSKIIFSCLDSLRDRLELEAFARRHNIIVIDFGTTIYGEKGNYASCGQVVMSKPGGPCFRCVGFITDKALELEDQKYGAAGMRPQVVWSNGILANLAIGLAVDLLTSWSNDPKEVFYVHYDGNKLELKPNPNMKKLSEKALSCKCYG